MSGRDLEAAVSFVSEQLTLNPQQSEPSKWEQNPVKDEQGDHVSNQLPEANSIGRLLHQQNSTSIELIRISTTNSNLSAASDVYYQSTGGVAMQGIPHLLPEAGSLESMPTEAERRQTWETKNVILLLVSFIGGAVFTTTCNLPSSFLMVTGEQEFRAKDVITAQLPSIFYLMVFNSAVFAMCLIAVLVLAWSIPFGSVIMFSSVTIGVVYAILVKNIMPKMSVRVGNCSIGGTYLVWLLALSFILAGATLCFCFSRAYKVIKRVISEKIREFQNSP